MSTSHVNRTPNHGLQDLFTRPIDRRSAKALVVNNHYMKTFPQGAVLYFGIFDSLQWNKPVGVCVFGYSAATRAKVDKILPGMRPSEYIEMQRLWISDECGHNSESYCLASIMKSIKKNSTVRVVITHSGGCKNDCGIVYQSSGWIYLGKEPCRDFYLTTDGCYKNIIAGMRFGRVKSKGKTPQQIGEELFGPGKIIDAHRYCYMYPIDKALRRRLNKSALTYPKDSDMFRYMQKWQT